MSMQKKQSEFVVMVSSLINYASELGYELTLGDGYRDPRVFGNPGTKKGYGHTNSKHKSRLAIDFNLFINGDFQTSTEAHKPLGEFWESIGGKWGGRFSNPDGNHYQL